MAIITIYSGYNNKITLTDSKIEIDTTLECHPNYSKFCAIYKKRIGTVKLTEIYWGNNYENY